MEYSSPHLTALGTVAQLTLGMNGSSLDGNTMVIINNQLGFGNDGTGPH
jgi:hypothetical protein